MRTNAEIPPAIISRITGIRIQMIFELFVGGDFCTAVFIA